MDGSPAPDHRIAELYFADEAALGQAGGSEEGKAAFAHAGQIATGGLDAMVVQVEEGQSRS